jgi:tetratricopeptide (TPR) repeat protein
MNDTTKELSSEEELNIGCDLRLSGEYAAAIERLRRALEIDPDCARAHAELGSALVSQAEEHCGAERLERLRIALGHLKRSVELEPDYDWSRLYLGNALWNLGKTREALVQYEAAVRINPSAGFIHAFCADFLSTALGPSPMADARFKKAIELDAEDDTIRYLYGKHLLRAKRYAGARRELLLADRLGNEKALGVLAAIEDDT